MRSMHYFPVQLNQNVMTDSDCHFIYAFNSSNCKEDSFIYNVNLWKLSISLKITAVHERQREKKTTTHNLLVMIVIENNF